MSEFRLEDYTMPAAEIEGLNPLPPMRRRLLHGADKICAPKGLEDELPHFGYGRFETPLPYRLQHRYGRRREPKTFKAVVLENRYIRATFLPEVGGKLWSLVHKETGRELLARNPVYQPANLGFRDAWTSGGVEWNIGVIAHSPFTCSSVFAARVDGADNTPVLRLWEWERRRRVLYQIDAWLPDNSPLLRVRWRVLNPNENVVPLSQWSNIGVPETPRTRVLVPADTAYVHRYHHGDMYSTASLPVIDGVDATCPTRIPGARDCFYRIADHQRPWVAALDGQGCGLIQTSTSLQKGRKLYVWGMATGGRRWQELLSVPGLPYFEIQAGLTRTQMQSLPMPAGAVWEWLEAYGLMEADADRVHGADWRAAYTDVGTKLDAMLSAQTMERELADAGETADRVPAAILHRGSGWGALERHRREREGEQGPWLSGVVFDDESITPDQVPWVTLLAKGFLPEREPACEPGAFILAPPWRRMLRKSIEQGKSDHWLGWFHLGLMAFDADEVADQARDAWENSLRHAPNAWACRCLAVLAQHNRDAQQAADLYLKALALLPDLPDLVAETCTALNRAGRSKEVMALWETLSPEVRDADRVLLGRAAAAVQCGDYQTTLDIVGSREFACIREGETSLTQLWSSAHELKASQEEGVPIDRELRIRVRREFPAPAAIDFRMRPVTPEEELDREEQRHRSHRRSS